MRTFRNVRFGARLFRLRILRKQKVPVCPVVEAFVRELCPRKESNCKNVGRRYVQSSCRSTRSLRLAAEVVRDLYFRT